MNATETVVATVEGPNGTAQVVELPGKDGKGLIYETRFKGQTQTFLAMGEAYIEAKEKAGVKA